jgi:SAM-dependent methyltransferase
MAKQGEIDYLRNIGWAGVRHALDKPYSDPSCGMYLRDIGCILDLLPPPPARLLDLGCGSGWTSVLFARRGYDVVGQDIASDMIDLAEQNKSRAGLDNIRFLVCDYENLPFDAEFDAAVFNESLHHAVDEEAALRSAYRALKPGGICVTNEPGEGHAAVDVTRNAVERYGVTEKDMPPYHIMRQGQKVGFRHFRVCQRGLGPPPVVFDTQQPWQRSRYWHCARSIKHALGYLLFGVGRPSLERPTLELRVSNIVVLIK